MIDGPNVYAFVSNSPVNFVDPWGLCGENNSYSTKIAEYYYKYNKPHYKIFQEGIDEAITAFQKNMEENFIYWQVSSQTNPKLASAEFTRSYIEESIVYNSKRVAHSLNYMGWVVIDNARAIVEASIDVFILKKNSN